LRDLQNRIPASREIRPGREEIIWVFSEASKLLTSASVLSQSRSAVEYLMLQSLSDGCVGK
jgi:hypothetical protein